MAVNYKDFLSDWSKSPVTTSIKELKEDRQKVRDLNRITAIENAKKSAINEKGELDYGKLRQNLFEQGFGENAEELVQDIATKRAQASGTRNTQMMQDASMYQMGLMSPEEFNRRWFNAEKVVEKVEKDPLEESKQIFGDITPDYTQQTIPQTIPQTSKNVGEMVSGKVGEIVVKPEVSQKVSDTFTLPEIKTPEKIIQKTPAQISPDFLTESGDISKSMYNKDIDGNVISNGVKFKLPEDNVERNYVVNAAKNVLGTDFKGDVNSENIDSRISEMAESQVPQIGSFNSYKSIQEYFSALKDRPAKVSEKKAEIIGKIAAERNARFTQDLAKRGDIRAELGEKRAEEAQKFELAGQKAEGIFYRPVSKDEATKVKQIIAEFPDVYNAYKVKNFESAYNAALSMAKIDGSVAAENVINNLVAMKALPSSVAVQIKTRLDPNAPLSKEFVNLLKDEFIEGSGASQEWVERATQKMNDMLYVYGGNPIQADFSESSTKDQKPSKSVADMLNDKAKQSKSKTDSNKTQTDPRASTKGR